MFRQRDYPPFVVVRDEDYDIRFVRKLYNDQGEPVVGLCDPHEKVIYLRQKQSGIELARTFVHEVLHAFEEEWGFELPHHFVEKLEDPILFFLLANFSHGRGTISGTIPKSP